MKTLEAGAAATKGSKLVAGLVHGAIAINSFGYGEIRALGARGGN